MSDEIVIIRDKGKFAKGTQSPAPITHANARDMQAKSAQARRNRAMQASQRRVLAEAASIDPTVTSWEEAYGMATAKQYLALLDSDKPRGDDLINIGRVMGALPMQHETRADDSVSTSLALSRLVGIDRLICLLGDTYTNVIDGDTEEV